MPTKTTSGSLTAAQITYAVKRIESLRDSKIKKLEDSKHVFTPSAGVRDAERAETVRQLAKFNTEERTKFLTIELDHHSGYTYDRVLMSKITSAKKAISGAGNKVRTSERISATATVKRIKKKFTEAADRLMFDGSTPTVLSALFASLEQSES